MPYKEFFFQATGVSPFAFQERLRVSAARTTVLKAPTGLGKTDSVLVAWLHRLVSEPATTPRRLVWCLPGRALTEQVAQVAERRIETLGLTPRVKVYRLMGGSKDNALTLRPDEAAVLVGTQDVLLSRALNRGYARRPFRWPIDFSLLNNDCFWVMDEVQLLGDGLATSTQLAAFRERFGTFGGAPSCWISATVDLEWMRTVDFPGGAAEVIDVVRDGGQIMDNHIVRKRLNAEKTLARAPIGCRLPQGVTEFVAARHAAGTLTLVIANTARRAAEIRAALEKKTPADVRLLHSRFRATDRKRHVEAALGGLPEAGRIVVATQVIEAGIDIDATLMVSDLAPYASMVQRFGRVNRKGERTGCEIYWVDRPLGLKQKALADATELGEKDLEKIFLPYGASAVVAAEKVLSGMKSAAPADLPELNASPAPWKHVLRQADLLDLFDTSADLAGNEIDISRFVRSDPEKDVYVFWRDWGNKDEAPKEDFREIDEGELCHAPIGEVPIKAAWGWNAAEGVWIRPENPYPGMTLLLHVSAGMYTEEFGWKPDSKEPVKPVTPSKESIEKNDDDRKSYAKHRQTLEAHTEQVCAEMQKLIEALPGLGLEAHHEALSAAARFHDWGKAHPVMQETLRGSDAESVELLAKSSGNAKHDRPFFRHELVSALAMIGAGESDLAAYVTAAHHGRIRVVVRSMPGERIAGGEVRLRGIVDGDSLLECSLGGGIACAATTVHLEAAKLGGLNGEDSWTERVLRLRDEVGPFRLAYLEMLLRIADETASAKAAEEAKV